MMDSEKDREEKELAYLLHDRLCQGSHIDQCSWFLFDPKLGPRWGEYPRLNYLEMARNMLKATDYVTASVLVSMIHRV